MAGHQAGHQAIGAMSDNILADFIENHYDPETLLEKSSEFKIKKILVFWNTFGDWSLKIKDKNFSWVKENMHQTC